MDGRRGMDEAIAPGSKRGSSRKIKDHAIKGESPVDNEKTNGERKCLEPFEVSIRQEFMFHAHRSVRIPGEHRGNIGRRRNGAQSVVVAGIGLSLIHI